MTSKLWSLATLAALWGAGLAPAQSDPPVSPWDGVILSNPPEWAALERPKADGVRAVSFAGVPYRGKPTRVFAWLGVPQVKTGEKVPAMVLVHGGGGTAFEEWVRLWVDRGYAAIAMDTCGQVPVGNYGHWAHVDRGGPPGWGGFDQVDWPRENQWTYDAVADVILAHSLIRSLPEGTRVYYFNLFDERGCVVSTEHEELAVHDTLRGAAVLAMSD